MRVILDTNVFISGIFWSGPPAKILKAWEDDQISIVVSPDILEEYKRVGEILNQKYPDVDLTSLFDTLVFHAEICPSMNLPEPVCEDKDDDKFLACALVSRVKTIVSGDKHLLDVSGYEGIEIIKPAQFVKNYLKK